MAELQYKTNGNANPHGKPRVFLTCHPTDLVGCLDQLSRSLYETQDCAVYYTPDMTEVFSEEDKGTQLGRMNLFVIPVSLNLLTTPNRAIGVDFPFAISQHIPVLPIMLQPGLEPIYSLPDRFGELQYLDPNAKDNTAIPYEEKLKKYLSSVLISNETAERVRKAFDAYIFLSYRKKDRKYANELMRLIHAQSECRDVAIWFDEYLVPGESFRDAIGKALENSELCTLLVTPNLVNEPNYEQSTEYPAAKESGKPILPVQVEETDRAKLFEQFPDIPDCSNPMDSTFRTRLLDSLASVALRKSDDPMHNYLIGLAYFDGIDVETDRKRGLELITSAGEAELLDAIIMLYTIYADGNGVKLDYSKALIWAERLYEYQKRTDGEKHPETIKSLCNLSTTFTKLGNYEKALELSERAYFLFCEVLGEMHPDTLNSLCDLAGLYTELGNHEKALELHEKAYISQCIVLGKKHPDTLRVLNNLSITINRFGNYRKALVVSELAYALSCDVLGEKHPRTLGTLGILATAHMVLGNFRKALELGERAYALYSEVLGEMHPDTLESLRNLAAYCERIGNNKEALNLGKRAYDLSCEVLGDNHPDTLIALNNIAVTYGKIGDYKKELELVEKAYTLQCEILGNTHPQTLKSLGILATAYSELGDHTKALELERKAYDLSCETLGETHPDTLIALNNLAVNYGKLGDHKKKMELAKKAYTLQCEVLGETHPDALKSLASLVAAYGKLGEYTKALELGEKAYTLQCEILGETHPYSLITMKNLAVTYGKLGNHTKELELAEKAYTLQCEILGETHPDSIASLHNLISIRNALKDRNKVQETNIHEILRLIQKRIKNNRLLFPTSTDKRIMSAIQSYASGVKPEDVIAIEDYGKAGLFSRKAVGLLFTEDALYSSYFTERCFLAYRDIKAVSLYDDGLRFTLASGESLTIDFGSSNEFVHTVFNALCQSKH